MITEFIGQGLENNPNQSTGNYIRSTLKNSEYNTITVFSAFLRNKAISQIKRDLIKKGRNITFFVGIDEQITSKEALEHLLKLNIETYLYISNQFIFHPKLYLFEGKLKSRIILGSSNATIAGLFFNVESSILLDFNNNDKSGAKVLRQIKEYYSPLLEFSSENLIKLNKKKIDELYAQGKISSEKLNKGNNELNKTHDFTKKFTSLPDIENLEDIEISESINRTFKYELKLTEEYLEKWDDMFNQMKAFKEEFNKTTVPARYHDRTLYGWYRKQKDIYNHPTLEMPKEHLEKLNSINFHFGDGHKERERAIEIKWLNLLKEAISQNDEVKVNHRYKFNGETLGTFLVGLKAANKKGKKLSLRKEVESTGFSFESTSRKPNDVARRFVEELFSDPNPNKGAYQTRFNHYIIPKRKILDVKIIQELNKVWELKFNEKRTWEKESRLQNRTAEWKQFRYDSSINPKGVWSTGQKDMGEKLYLWVRQRKINSKMMALIINQFNQKELQELKEQGFPVK